MSSYIQQAINAIIRPPRTSYDVSELPLVLNTSEEEDFGVFLRHPFKVQNNRGQNIVGSLYHLSTDDPTGGGPCVIYLHGNASSQLEGQFLVPNLCPHHIKVFCFDFIGCGCSDGDYVSLGYYEKFDTEFIIGLLVDYFGLGPFILWGRSMGAATCLLVNDPRVVGKVSDSAFTSVEDMCSAIAKSMSLPSLFVPTVVKFLNGRVNSAAKFDFSDVSPLKNVTQNATPVVYGHAEDDQFIPFEQCRTLYDAHGNDMRFLMVLPGGHNSRRDINWITLGVSFILNMFKINVTSPRISECRKLQSSDFHFHSFSELVKNAPKNDMESVQNICIEEPIKTENVEVPVVETKTKKHKHSKDKTDEKSERKHRKKHDDKDHKKSRKDTSCLTDNETQTDYLQFVVSPSGLVLDIPHVQTE